LRRNTWLIAVASIILAGIEVSFLVLLNFMALPFAVVLGLIAAHGFGMNPLFIWIGISTGIAILSTLVVLIRFRQRQQELPQPTIYLARHCKTAWNCEGRVQGTKDIELSPEGAHDAELNLPAIRSLGIQQIVCSNAKRSMQTATIYAQGLGVPLQSSPRFRELDHGEWEGQRIEDLLNLPNSQFERWMADSGAVLIPGSSETALTAKQRILDGVREICSTYDGKTILLVSHKHILAILNCALRKCPLTQFRNEIVESTLPYKARTQRE
jgi:probable phosphoglycerate mutase